MSQTKSSELSPFLQAAVDLDEQFSQLDRLSGHIDRHSLDGEGGLERARELLSKFSAVAQGIATGVQNLAQRLEEARMQAERASQIVANRAASVQARQEVAEQMLARFQNLGDQAREVSDAVGKLQGPEAVSHLPELDARLGGLVEEAQKLQQDAQASHLKAYARNAESLGQTLQTMRGRLADAARSVEGAQILH
ncbi:MAG: hypothetical protein AB7P04_05580 [Bacteriovoracia bacterium]